LTLTRPISRAKAKLTRWSIRGGRLRQWLYSRVLSEALGREGRHVAQGIRKYYSEVGSGSERFLLRRNVHMLEKGLVMRPRRDTFATEYIGRTVESFRLSLRDRSTSALGEGELVWMWSVLEQYFDATASSDSPLIAEQRRQFHALRAQNAPSVRPVLPPSDGAPTVSIEDLTALADRRTSVRWFLDKQVPRAVVEGAVRVALESPTACNRQPYRYEIFDDPVSVGKVAALPMGTRGYAHQLPGIIVVVGDLSAFFDERDRHLIYVDSCLATMALIFALEAQGVATCCINWPDLPDREARMAKLLGLESYERVVMLLAYGYADPAGLVPSSAKRDLDSVRTFRRL
jgi:nitroreductase